MGSSKKQQKTFLPWLTANPNGFHDREGRYVEIPMGMFMDSRLGLLSGASFRLYFCMAIESKGKHTFKFSHSDAKKYQINPNTFDHSVRELISVRMIEEINNDELNRFKEKEFRFTPEYWKAMSYEDFRKILNPRKGRKRKDEE